jgi:hypothetical protein
MDFPHRAERMLASEQPALFDFDLLLAALAAQQGTSGEPAPVPRTECGEPLVEVVLAGPRWREAAAEQGGCFSRAEAGRRVNV